MICFRGYLEITETASGKPAKILKHPLFSLEYSRSNQNMLAVENNQSEQTARFLIDTIAKAVRKGDLKSASRRAQRVKSLAADRSLDRGTLGELLLAAAEVERACGKNAPAAELVAVILNGKGGMKMEILGHAKRLRARLLLDAGKPEEAAAAAGTADRYILTGLMEEKVEYAAGREIRVNVPVEQKFLDDGADVSVETYLLLAEIAALQNDWEKVVGYVRRAEEKQNRDGMQLPEFEMWRAILQMANGGSFIEIVEPIISHKNTPAILIGRIEALLGEPRREDSPINEIEFHRFRRISELARELPFKHVAGSLDAAILEDSDSATKVNSASDKGPADAKSVEWKDKLVIDANLSQMSMTHLLTIIDLENVTGVMTFDWNYEAVREGIEGRFLDTSADCGSGVIYCRDGRFIDAEFVSGGVALDSERYPAKKADRGIFFLRQLLLIAMGGGSKLLHEIQSKKVDDIETLKKEGVEIPKVTVIVQKESFVAEMDNNAQISSNLNFLLNVLKEKDERNSPGNASQEEEELNWDADWGAPSKPTEVAAAAVPIMVKSSELKHEMLTNIIDIVKTARLTGYLEMTWKPELYKTAVAAEKLPKSIEKGKGYLFLCDGEIIDAAVGKTDCSTAKNEAVENFHLLAQMAFSIGVEEIPCEITVEAYEFEEIALRPRLVRILPDHMMNVLTEIANRVYGIVVEEESREEKSALDYTGSEVTTAGSIDAAVDALLSFPVVNKLPLEETTTDGSSGNQTTKDAIKSQSESLPRLLDDDLLLELD